jgi:hypothetical protein
MVGNTSLLRRRVAILAGVLATVAFGSVGQARAGELLGVPLPSATIDSTLTQGGPPNFADTFVTPYSTATGGVVTTWKAQFTGGFFPPIGADEGGPFEGGPAVPVGIQLKVFRSISPTTLQVVAAGAVHDPRPILQARFGASYPFFLDSEAVIEFSETGLTLQPGDVIGLTIMSDPLIGRYAYSLIGSGQTPIVLRNVGVGALIDLGNAGRLPWPPAVQVEVSPPVTPVRIDIKPGGFPNSINLQSNGTVAVAIFSSPSFDATTVDPLTVSLAGASVALAGKGTPMASFADVDGDGLLDLVVHFRTSALQLKDTDKEAVLDATTFAGESITGTDSIRVVS